MARPGPKAGSPRPLRVYIAGPYSAAQSSDVHGNVQAAVDAAIDVLLKGHWPFIPHLTHYVDLRARARHLEIAWSSYIDWDLQWLQFCDALLYLGSSPGADIELEAAHRIGIPVFDSVEALPRVLPTPSDTTGLGGSSDDDD
jgi:hypothetical protein